MQLITLFLYESFILILGKVRTYGICLHPVQKARRRPVSTLADILEFKALRGAMPVSVAE